MYKSALIHAAFALAFTLGIGVSTGNWWAGAAGGSLFFLGREHAQRQYQIANGRSIKDLRPWEGFDLFKWSKDHTLDWTLSAVASCGLAAWITFA